MDLTSLAAVKFLVKKYNIQPRDYKGQNFLIAGNVLAEILQAANLTKDDLVLEVGAGLGVLTCELAQRVRKVLAVEKDPKLIPVLRQNLSTYKNVKIINDDILKLHLVSYLRPVTNYKIVANLPYGISAAFLKKFLTSENSPREMTLLLQKEVAERITAKAPQMSVLALSVQFYAEPELIGAISARSFWPTPRVESALVKIKNIKSQPNSPEIENFFQLVKAGFSSRRKQLKNNLSRYLAISPEKIQKIIVQMGLKPQARAQELDLQHWQRLVKLVK